MSSDTSFRASIRVHGRAPLGYKNILGGLGTVIHLGDVAAGSHLVQELLAGKEPVHQEVEALVQAVEEVHLLLGVMSVILHELPDHRVVLLFHMGVVVLVIGTGTDNTPRLGQKGSGVRMMSWL